MYTPACSRLVTLYAYLRITLTNPVYAGVTLEHRCSRPSSKSTPFGQNTLFDDQQHLYIVIFHVSWETEQQQAVSRWQARCELPVEPFLHEKTHFQNMRLGRNPNKAGVPRDISNHGNICVLLELLVEIHLLSMPCSQKGYVSLVSARIPQKRQ